MNPKMTIIAALVGIFLLTGCSDNQQAEEETDPKQEPAETEQTAATGDEKEILEILATWTGDYPVDALDKIPADQQSGPVGYIGEEETFAAVWEEFQPLRAVPDVDFDDQIVVFYRNVTFYNSTNIFEVELKDGVATVQAMQTKSAIPIEDNVFMAMAAISREGIKGIKGQDEIIGVE